MKDIEKLSNSLQLLKNHEEVDININIPVSGVTLFECKEYNKIICFSNKTDLTFDDTRLIFPHVTLRMGTVKSGEFEKVLIKLNKLFENVKVMELVPKPIILKPPADKYYFSEIYDERLLSISSEIDSLLETELKEAEFGLCKDNVHHITLGFKNATDLNVAPIIGKSLCPFVADRIQISIKGQNGVCIGVLKTFYLQNK